MTTPSAAAELSSGPHLLRLDAVERLDDRLALEVTVRVGRFSAVSACDVPVDDLRTWREALQRTYDTLSGVATLDQPGLRVHVAGDGTGHLTVEGDVAHELGWGDGARAALHFALPVLDQSHLPAVVAALDAALALEPEPDLWT